MEAFSLFEKHGGKGYIGEEVTQLQHAVQAAKQAEHFCNNANIPEKRDIVLGAFFHDIGHLLCYEFPEKYPLMGNIGVYEHEIYGANYLRGLGYSELTCAIVENHIRTKRYLITKNVAYYNRLSDASKKTFEYQGGKLNEREMNDFENDPLFNFHLKMRHWDDCAKNTTPHILADTANYFEKIKSTFSI